METEEERITLSPVVGTTLGQSNLSKTLCPNWSHGKGLQMGI